jgi:8-oxo-dGTP pyrophosphatase MutT (NUDIX family)
MAGKVWGEQQGRMSGARTSQMENSQSLGKDVGMSSGRFNAGVGALLFDAGTEKYLLLRRSDDKDYAAGVWECVTGRVDQGEGFEDALRREIREETGIEGVEIDFIVGTTHFYRGPADADNELIGVGYVCSVQGPATVTIGAEHSEYRWLAADQAMELLAANDPSTQWMRRVIERAEAVRAQMPAGLTRLFRQNGFELG